MGMTQLLKRFIRHAIPLAVVITLTVGVVYVIVQQSFRMTANDPQVQLAEDAARALSGGQSINMVVPSTVVDIQASLAPYLVVYDHNGRAIAGSGRLHDQLPALPPGVFDYATHNGEDRITWQPEPGVRSAIVLVPYTGTAEGFVMAGRSLREVEAHIDQLTLLTVAGWLGILGATLVITFLVELILADKS